MEKSVLSGNIPRFSEIFQNDLRIKNIIKNFQKRHKNIRSRKLKQLQQDYFIKIFRYTIQLKLFFFKSIKIEYFIR